MRTVILDVKSTTDTFAEIAKVARSGKGDREARISFATPELLWEVLTLKRWELIKSLCGAGALSIREVARRVHRDVKAVHGDVHALLQLFPCLKDIFYPTPFFHQLKHLPI